MENYPGAADRLLAQLVLGPGECYRQGVHPGGSARANAITNPAAVVPKNTQLVGWRKAVRSNCRDIYTYFIYVLIFRHINFACGKAK